MAQEEKPKKSELLEEIELAGMTEMSEIIDPVRELASELVQVKARARELGLFVGDRSLLECSHCRLLEDVTIEGFLVVYSANRLPTAEMREESDPATRSWATMDTGLRFAFLSEERILCPACSSVFAPPDEEEPDWSVWGDAVFDQTDQFNQTYDAEEPEGGR